MGAPVWRIVTSSPGAPGMTSIKYIPIDVTVCLYQTPIYNLVAEYDARFEIIANVTGIVVNKSRIVRVHRPLRSLEAEVQFVARIGVSLVYQHVFRILIVETVTGLERMVDHTHVRQRKRQERYVQTQTFTDVKTVTYFLKRFW